MSSPAHRWTSSIHALVLLPGKHFPSISPSIVARTTLSLLLFQWQYLDSFRCLICSKMPFSSSIPVFSRIHVLVFRSVQLILSIQCHTHISKAVTSFSSHFFSAQLSGPYNVVLHISDCTSCFFRSMPMSFAFQIPVSCRVACLAITSLAFISVVLLLSTVTTVAIRFLAKIHITGPKKPESTSDGRLVWGEFCQASYTCLSCHWAW